VTLSTGQILAQSSNVGAITIGERLGARRFDDWVHRFGFGTTTDSGLPGESPGIVPRFAQYSGSSMGKPADRPGPRGNAAARWRRRTVRSRTAGCSCGRA